MRFSLPPLDHFLGRAFAFVVVIFGYLAIKAVFTWQTEVSRLVTTPYLDEEFHVRQAQTYCNGCLLEWDPKITTPPGLYLVIWILHKTGLACDLSTIRLLGGISLLAGIAPLAFLYRRAKRKSSRSAEKSSWKRQNIRVWLSDLHVALNVALFPPVFFFAGLFYTDVISTAMVLVTLNLSLCYNSCQHATTSTALRYLIPGILIVSHANGKLMPLPYGIAGFVVTYLMCALLKAGDSATPANGPPNKSIMTYDSIKTNVLLTISGCLALAFRQTNIFWVAAFPAGLALAQLMRSDTAPKGLASKFVDSMGLVGQGDDKAVQIADVIDYFQTVITLVAYTIDRIELLLLNPTKNASRQLAGRLAPYICLILVFGAFVIWNGGVVLGDKSNHVSTIHLPQMLYIWPFMIFFSWPLAYPWILGALVPVAYLPAYLKPYATNAVLSLKDGGRLPLILVLVVLTLGIAHFNTIIHPFTLADNRHYVFYVFRILRLHPWLFYAAAPVYIASAWAILQTLCRIEQLQHHRRVKDNDNEGKGLSTAQGKSTAIHSGNEPVNQANNSDRKNQNATATDDDGTRNSEAVQKSKSGSTNDASNLEPTRASWVIVWLTTSTLCLATAPLVEPRYYILPWLLWRLEVPSMAPRLAPADSRKEGQQEEEEEQEQGNAGLLRESARLVYDASDHRIWLETGWFVLVNLATCHVFLHRPFESVNEWEKGELRRFMW